MAKLSVVVPVYKKESYIRACLDSVLAQTMQDIQLVVVDDGSPDGCPAICDEYAARDGRVLVIHKPNGGLVSAWKAGVQAASGEYVGFVDGDDWVDPDYFQTLYQAVTGQGADVAVAEFVRDAEPGAVVPPYTLRQEGAVYEGEQGMSRFVRQFLLDIPYGDRTFKGISSSRCDKLYRRQLFLDNMAFFNEKLTAHEDAIANTAIFLDCRKVVVLSHAAKYHYRILAASMSHGSGADMQIFDIGEVYRSFAAISREKGLDMRLADAYIGSVIYCRVYLFAVNPAMDGAARLARCREALAAAPATVTAYARHRGGLAIRLLCGLLRLGLVRPCIWAIRLFDRLKG